MTSVKNPQVAMADFRAKPTEAMPKNSLFGCGLEIHDKSATEKIMKIDINTIDDERESQRVAKQNRYKAMLPENVKRSLPENALVEESRSALAKQLQQTTSARKNVDMLEERSKFFEIGVHGKPVRSKTSKAAETMQDVWPVDEINRVGLGEDGKNYDHQRHQRRIPFHLNTDTKPSPNDTGNKTRYQYKRHRAPDWLPRQDFMNATKHEPAVTTIDLPPNIQHQFGSRTCSDVLSDQDKVDKSLHFLKERRSGCARNRPSVAEPAKLDEDSDPMYTSLGNSLRQNICPGYSASVKDSTAKSVYTEDIHKRRYPDPEEYRYQRDALSQWAEFNVIHQRMKKKWEEYLQSQPKQQPNWDRDAKRVRQATQKQEEKPKPKRLKPKPTKPEKQPFEDVVFVTPPLTPPPPKPDIARKPSFTRDDEFWSFYDQEAPK